jgi:signal transduction histidine kinase/CHASE3 domain sensor protein
LRNPDAMTTAMDRKYPPMRLGLTGRILLAGGIVVAVLLVRFVLLVHSFNSVTDATEADERAERAVFTAQRLEKLVLDLETGARGYVITQDPAFLEPWRSARRALPAQSRELLEAAPGDQSRRIDAAWRAYLRDWSMPLVAGPVDEARARIASGEGKRRVDRIRALIDPLIAAQMRVSDTQSARVAKAERQGERVSAVGIAITILAFVLMVGYVLRRAVLPLRRVVAAHARIARGEQDVEVPEGGAGEVGALAAGFNSMSRSLSATQSSLAAQNDDLERLANVLRAVLDSTVDGILLSDAAGEVQLANRPVIRLTRDLGMSFEGPVVDRLLSVADRMADPEAYRAAMERLRTNPDEPTFDEFEDAASGRVFQGFTAPVVDDRGGFLGRIWTLREVTEQRELDRLKDDFVATVSHELRTPLTSMMGFLEMIREGEAGPLNEEQQRFLAIVYRSSERLQRLVGDLLFVARLDASGLQLHFAQVDVTEVVREAVESAAALARSRTIDLRSELGDVPVVSGDRERLLQLVGNLVSNALKFTPAAGTVTARTLVDGASVVIEVTDTGIGIPESEQARVFQRFFRSSTATEQAIPGTGLGLVISRAIAEAHGGSISVRSAPGAGASFRVELPYAVEEAAA